MLKTLIISTFQLVLSQTCSVVAGNSATESLSKLTTCLNENLINQDDLNSQSPCSAFNTDFKQKDDCLCKRYTSFLNCYKQECPNDQSLWYYLGLKEKSCGEVIPEVERNVFAKYTGKSNGLGPYMSFTLVFGEVIALTILTNLV